MSGPHSEWFDRAENDIQFAEVGLREGFHAQVCFLSQQAIEKLLKGSLVILDRPYPKSHNLRELAKLLPELKMKEHYESLTIIDGYYVPIRYPDGIPGSTPAGSPNRSEAESALETAREIWNLVMEYSKTR